MKWFWEAKKGLEPLTLMADVSLAAMAGVTAAHHERISKIVLDHLRVSGRDEHVPAIGTV